jgi:hypothetical protein
MTYDLLNVAIRQDWYLKGQAGRGAGGYDELYDWSWRSGNLSTQGTS